MPKPIFGLLASAFMALSPAAALAGSGTALGVDPAAEARQASQVRQLVIGADVSIGERVVTGASGQVQIRFGDSTELVVGPSSSLLIEDYLLRADGSAGKLAINALAGTFRFVTGGAPKDRYTIKTPTATIGVRGTAFELNVSPLRTSVLMQHGAVEACNEAGECMVLEARCEVGQVSPGEAVVIGHADGVGGNDRDRLKQMFIYAVSQRQLLPAFRISDAERCLRRPASAAAAPSLSQPARSVPMGPVVTPPPSPAPGPADPVWNEDTGCWDYSDGQDSYCI